MCYKYIYFFIILLKGRIDKHVYLGLPDKDERLDIL
jgi:SpoVK/Ycf46/Vps4 family AAA+-type ATPase